jgi:hypothetical protein
MAVTLIFRKPRFHADPRRFLDRAQDIDYAYQKADEEVGKKVPRPRDYKAGVCRARAKLLEEGSESEKKAIFEIADRM